MSNDLTNRIRDILLEADTEASAEYLLRVIDRALDVINDGISLINVRNDHPDDPHVMAGEPMVKAKDHSKNLETKIIDEIADHLSIDDIRDYGRRQIASDVFELIKPYLRIMKMAESLPDGDKEDLGDAQWQPKQDNHLHSAASDCERYRKVLHEILYACMRPESLFFGGNTQKIAKIQVAVENALHPKPKLLRYDPCECVLHQYCDGKCRPVFCTEKQTSEYRAENEK